MSDLIREEMEVNFKKTILFLAAYALAACASAGNIYVMSSGNVSHDDSVRASLASAGHTSVIGVEFTQFDGTVPLTGYDAVFLQANYNWATGVMPLAGEQQLVAYVNGGGGLVTSEWVLWLTGTGGHFQTLKTIFPSVATTSYNGDIQHTFSRVDSDPTINSGLPNTFDIDGDNVAGGETNVAGVAPGAKLFYQSTRNGSFVGLSGLDFGAGRVAQFSETVSERFMADPEGFRLLGNVMEWVSHGAGTIQVNPDTITLRLGRVDIGGIGQISDIDGLVYRVCKFIVPNQQVAPITVEISGTCPISNPSQMQFRTYGRMNTTGLFSETLDMYDWSLNNFSPTAVTVTNISNAYKAAGVGANAPISRFINASGRVTGRYRIRQTGPSGAAVWCFELDQAVWLVRP